MQVIHKMHVVIMVICHLAFRVSVLQLKVGQYCEIYYSINNLLLLLVFIQILL